MQTSDARILRSAAIPSVLAGLAAVAVGALAAGAAGALGAAVGSALVIAFFGVSVVAVSYASKISPQLMAAAAVLSYVAKILGMFALISVFRGVTAWEPQVFAWSVIALTLVWLGAEVRATMKLKMSYVDEPVDVADLPVTGPRTPGTGTSASGDRSR